VRRLSELPDERRDEPVQRRIQQVFHLAQKSDEATLGVQVVVVNQPVGVPHLKVIELTEMSRAGYEVRGKTIRLSDGAERNSRVLSGERGTRPAALFRVRWQTFDGEGPDEAAEANGPRAVA
jgi:hypothetical protein